MNAISNIRTMAQVLCALTKIEKPWTPSIQQRAVMDWVVDETGSLNLISRAGTGKSTTIVNGILFTIYCLMPRAEAVAMAFNKTAGKELKEKIAALGMTDWRRVSGGTFHSFGLAAFKRFAPNVLVDKENKKVEGIVNKLINFPETKMDVARDCGPQIRQLVSLAKQSALGVGTDIDDMAWWYDTASHHGVDEVSDEYAIGEIIEMSIKVLKTSISQNRDIIDFDDMIFAPLYHKVKFYGKDFVIIDEAQDTNRARRLLAERMLKRGTGRLIAVGDDRQAIYGFCHPPGTPVMTPSGLVAIEKLKKGSSVIIGATDGQTAGWNGGKTVKQVHKFDHSGLLITVKAGNREVEFTPHHRIPVRIDDAASYYTYLMERDGVYRVGFCQAYAKGGFMLTHRVQTEKSQRAWILGSYENKNEAMLAEQKLLRRIKGTTFHNKTARDLDRMPTEEIEALKILSEYGRMVDFPLIGGEDTCRIARNGAFVTEACNVMDGMKVAFWSEGQRNIRQGSKCSQRFKWTACRVSSRHYNGPVYGITVPTLQTRKGYNAYNLYFGGRGQILVHNTGADSDAMDLIQKRFNSKVLKLTVTYRCPKVVVEMAKKLVPDYEAHPSAPQGQYMKFSHNITKMVNKVEKKEYWFSQLEAANLKPLQYGDAIICRNTKYLVDEAYNLLRHGIGCIVEGREIGVGLIKLATRWRISNISALVPKLEEYRDREVKKWNEKKKPERADAVADKVDTLCVLIEKATEDKLDTINELIEFINSLFGDSADPRAPKVPRLMTGHKAKGLEFKRVFLLGREKLLPSKWAKKDHQLRQEENLEYVMLTRPIEFLADVVLKEAA